MKEKENTARLFAPEELIVTFPTIEEGDISQDQEWCRVNVDGEEREIRFHDYGQIYDIPGLYEHIFYDRLKCQSPRIIGALLGFEVGRHEMEMSDLRVLDVGAGNGMMGEVLAEGGVKEIVGVDILPEAMRAANRDRPEVYGEYYCTDLTDIPAPIQQELEEREFNCMTLIAALGFGDIPPEVFSAAYNLVEEDGLVAFNIKHEFLTGAETSEFSQLITRMIDSGWYSPDMRLRYTHRQNIMGEALCYDAFVGRKKRDIPASVLS